MRLPRRKPILIAVSILLVALVVVLPVQYTIEGLVAETATGDLAVTRTETSAWGAVSLRTAQPLQLNEDTVLLGPNGSSSELDAFLNGATVARATGSAPLWRLLLGLPVPAKAVEVVGST